MDSLHTRIHMYSIRGQSPPHNTACYGRFSHERSQSLSSGNALLTTWACPLEIRSVLTSPLPHRNAIFSRWSAWGRMILTLAVGCTQCRRSAIYCCQMMWSLCLCLCECPIEVDSSRSKTIWLHSAGWLMDRRHTQPLCKEQIYLRECQTHWYRISACFAASLHI